MSRRAALLLLVACGFVSGCGAEDRDGNAAGWRREADAAFAAGDAAEDVEAVEAWLDAADAYIFAFRMEDPVEARREARAMLAFRIGRSMSKAAQRGVTHPRRDLIAGRAVFWFGEARALAPSLHVATFERAVLFDSEIESVRDGVRARDEYARFMRELDLRSQQMSETESKFYAHARKRRAVLGDRSPGG